MAKVVWTAEAGRWLLKIHDYIAADSPANAFNVVKSIYERAQILVRGVLKVGAFGAAEQGDNKAWSTSEPCRGVSPNKGMKEATSATPRGA